MNATLVVFADGSFDSTTNFHGIGFCLASYDLNELRLIIAKGYPVSTASKSSPHEIEAMAIIEAIKFVSTIPHKRVIFLTDSKFVMSRYLNRYAKTTVNPLVCKQLAELLNGNEWINIQFFTESEIKETDAYLLRNITDLIANTARKNKFPETVNEFCVPLVIKEKTYD